MRWLKPPPASALTWAHTLLISPCFKSGESLISSPLGGVVDYHPTNEGSVYRFSNFHPLPPFLLQLVSPRPAPVHRTQPLRCKTSVKLLDCRLRSTRLLNGVRSYPSCFAPRVVIQTTTSLMSSLPLTSHVSCEDSLNLHCINRMSPSRTVYRPKVGRFNQPRGFRTWNPRTAAGLPEPNVAKFDAAGRNHPSACASRFEHAVVRICRLAL